MADGAFATTWFCVHHNPSPPTPEQLADLERQEVEAAAATLRAEASRIGSLMELDRPVSTVDRANIGFLLFGLQQRVTALGNEVRALRGQPPIPQEPLATDAPPVAGTAEHRLRPTYHFTVDYLGKPQPHEPFLDIGNVRFREFISIVQSQGGTIVSLSHDETWSSIKFTVQDDSLIDTIRHELDRTGRLQVRTIHYSADPPYSDLELLWSRA
jgi:hypothetical protein